MYKAILAGIVSGGVGFAAGYIFCKKKLEKSFVEKTEAALKDIRKLESPKNDKKEEKPSTESKNDEKDQHHESAKETVRCYNPATQSYIEMPKRMDFSPEDKARYAELSKKYYDPNRVREPVSRDTDYSAYIHVVPEEEFMADMDYDVIQLTLYADDILADDIEYRVQNPKELIGNALDILDDDTWTVYVKNDYTKTYYEVEKDSRTYQEVMSDPNVCRNPQAALEYDSDDDGTRY